MTANDLVTVVTATVGDSAKHLHVSMEELRRFTNIPFVQIVSDDGTDDGTDEGRAKKNQREVVESFDRAIWTENPGPVYGIGQNLNHLFSLVQTPWAFVIEDGVRPGKGWLETALDALEKIGLRSWYGYQVGGIGLVSSFDHWELAVAGIIPGTLADYFGRCSHETLNHFWHPGWNDGLICWPRILPDVRRACRNSEADSWPRLVQDTWRRPILEQQSGFHRADGGVGRHFGETDWPLSRRAWPALSPGSWSLIHWGAWKQVGGWREGCCFYEGHLGVRFAQNHYLSVNIDGPPWLHYPSMAFNAVHVGGMGRGPRELLPDMGPEGVFGRDFGCPDHAALTCLAQAQYPDDDWLRLGKALAEIQIHAEPEWLPGGNDA